MRGRGGLGASGCPAGDPVMSVCSGLQSHDPNGPPWLYRPVAFSQRANRCLVNRHWLQRCLTVYCLCKWYKSIMMPAYEGWKETIINWEQLHFQSLYPLKDASKMAPYSVYSALLLTRTWFTKIILMLNSSLDTFGKWVPEHFIRYLAHRWRVN